MQEVPLSMLEATLSMQAAPCSEVSTWRARLIAACLAGDVLNLKKISTRFHQGFLEVEWHPHGLRSHGTPMH